MNKVVYIMGAVRSGSTIVGVTLGNCDGFFYAGELDQWLRTCGRPAYPKTDTSAFWNTLHDRLRQYSDLCGDLCFRCFEHSSAVLRPARRWRARRLRPRYRRFNSDLYKALAEVARRSTIVDTAHYPLRARELRKLDDLDLYLILLVRNPHAVVEAFRTTQEPDGKGLWAANTYLWLTHFLSLLVYLSHPREQRVLVRYEDFATHTPTTVRRVLDIVGTPSPLPEMSHLDTGRPLAGNGILRSERVSVDSRFAELPRGRSLLTGLLQLPWTVAFAWMRR
jgi:hypothetical protein